MGFSSWRQAFFLEEEAEAEANITTGLESIRLVVSEILPIRSPNKRSHNGVADTTVEDTLDSGRLISDTGNTKIARRESSRADRSKSSRLISFVEGIEDIEVERHREAFVIAEAIFVRNRKVGLRELLRATQVATSVQDHRRREIEIIERGQRRATLTGEEAGKFRLSDISSKSSIGIKSICTIELKGVWAVRSQPSVVRSAESVEA